MSLRKPHRHRPHHPATPEALHRSNATLLNRLGRSRHDKQRLQWRNAVVRQNLSLVHQVAHRESQRTGLQFEDLRSVGYEGLIRAVERFDTSQGYALSSFAVPYIRGAMLLDRRDRQQPLRTPRRLRELQQRVERLQDKRRIAGLKPFTLELLAEQLNCPEERLAEASRMTRALKVCSLDQPVKDNDDAGKSLTLLDLQPSSEPGTGEPKDEQLSWLRQQLAQLSHQDQDLLEGRWIDGLTWQQLSRGLGCTSSQCRERANALLAQLQAAANRHQAAMAIKAATAV